MFDLSNGVVRTKLLADRSQGDVHKEQPDFVKKAINILGSQVTSKLWKSAGRKLGEKPVQMLIAQELSNTIELKEKPPGVVAKLMGLSSLPKTKFHSELRVREKGYRDGNEVKRRASTGIQFENENPRLEGYHRSSGERRMAVVHQKLMEAKRLATSEKLLQSKEFKDSLEVLSSNRDLFLKLLEEPNSIFSSQLKELKQTNSKCITLLKPTTSADSLFIKKAEAVSQSTRIVVLKASTEMPPESRYMNGDLGADGVSKGIAFRMQKDSALSSGYVANENSSEIEYRGGGDSELVAPASPNFGVRTTSGCPSYSFESSVSGEAKKRLSERWESVISNGVDLEQGNVRKKSSNTLGEMLAIPELKKEEEAAEEQLASITRSKSLPASSYRENIGEKGEVSRTVSGKSARAPKIKSAKASLKEKVSALFFSRVKALARDKPNLSGSTSDDNTVDYNRISYENSLKTLGGTEKKHGNASLKGICSISAFQKPSPDDDPLASIPHSSQSALISNPQALSRSPLISSVSRSSNWEALHPDSVPMNSFKLFRLFFKEDEERERLDFIAKLLSSSNLADERSTALLEKSHSLDSPLNPALLDELLERKGEEAKRRERRSNQMLYFDSVNIALKGICQCLLADAYPWPTAARRSHKRAETNLSVRDAVWFRIKDCFSEDEKCASGKAENSKKYVNYLVRREAGGGGLAESMWLEMDEVGKEICEEMLKELFDDTLADLTSWWL